MPLHVTIQLNENAEGNHDRWRLTINENEYFLAGIHLRVRDLLTGAEVNATGRLTYHLECEADNYVIDHEKRMATITMTNPKQEERAADAIHKNKMRAMGNADFPDFGETL